MKPEQEAGDRVLVMDQREHAGRVTGREGFEGGSGRSQFGLPTNTLRPNIEH
jgi:hypothetical protein